MLLKLSPDAVRLRRVAKAHAVGEFSTIEYRSIRREIIEQYDRLDGDDDTWTRQALDPEQTTRRYDLPPLVEEIQTHSYITYGVLFAVFVLCVVFASGAFARIVPPVSERDPNPITAPRYDIDAIEIRGLDDVAGIDPEAVRAFATAELAAAKAEHAPGETGFTREELEQLGMLLKALGAQDEAPLEPRALRDIELLLRQQRERRGVSLVTLEQIARSVAEFVRDRGLLLAVAFVPVQEVGDATVVIEVLPGQLGKVVVAGNPRLTGLAQQSFADLLSRPIRRGVVESRVFQLNDLPGLSTRAVFVPGEAVGESDLSLTFDRTRRFSGSLGLDNYGLDETGEERVVADASWLNVFGKGEVLRAGIWSSVSPADQQYAFAELDLPLFTVADRVSFGMRVNEFSPGEGLEDGDEVSVEGAWRRQYLRSRSFNVSTVTGLVSQQLRARGLSDQNVVAALGGISADRTWDAARIYGRMGLSADVGRITSGALPGQDDGFWRLRLDGHAWTLLPGFDESAKLLVRMAGQLSRHDLPASYRMDMGGPVANRGFDRGVAMIDRGLLMGLDLRLTTRFGEVIMFGDAGYGEQLDSQSPGWRHLASVGVGWETVLFDRWQSRISWALPMTTQGTGDIDAHGTRVYWSLRYAP